MITPELPADSPIPMEQSPAASICGFPLVPRVRAKLLALGDKVSLWDLRKHLEGGGISEPLASVARTTYEKRSLLEAYFQFIAAAAEDGPRLGRAKSDRLAWIIGNSRLTPAMELDSQTVDMIAKLGFAAQLGNDYPSWLPWMSLGIVTLFRRWRQPRIRTIHRAMFKLSAGTEVTFPWEPGYATWRRNLPVQALYRHEPSRLLGGVLATFSSLGLKSINDLRCCHPDAVSASKAKKRPLFILYRMLEQEGSSA